MHVFNVFYSKTEWIELELFIVYVNDGVVMCIAYSSNKTTT